jgi:hypothetical protein
VTVARYFHLFAIVPVAVHAGALVLVVTGVVPVQGVLRDALEFLALSAVGLVVYVPFALILAWILRGRSEAQLRRLTQFVPWLFAIAFALAAPLLGARPGAHLQRFLIALAYAYVYVALLLGSTCLLERTGTLSSERGVMTT